MNQTCPKCNRPAKFLGFLHEVDVGVGTIEADPEWTCEEHGAFAFVVADDGLSSSPIFQDDVSAQPAGDLGAT